MNSPAVTHSCGKLVLSSVIGAGRPASRVVHWLQLFPRPRRSIRRRRHQAAQERDVFSCDYNGWADVPEEEREGIDTFEAALKPPAPTPVSPVIRLLPPPAAPLPQRKAA
jgi:hypothetical protein